MTPGDPDAPVLAPGRRRMPAAERKAQIIAAAGRVFVDAGFAGARIQDISREAGVNEAVLYRHFASKEELFEAAIAEPLSRRVEGLLQLGEHAGEALAANRDLFFTELLSELLSAVSDLAPMLGVMLFAQGDRSRPFYETHVAPAIDRLAAAIEEHDDEWEHGEFSARLVVIFAVGACLMIAADRRLRHDGTDADAPRQLAQYLQAALERRG
jgi:AcrR family transcriptional regulator